MASSTESGPGVPVILPIINAQHDFNTVIADVQDGTVRQEDFWVSCYKKGETSVHGKVEVRKGEHSREPELFGRGVEFTRGFPVSSH